MIIYYLTPLKYPSTYANRAQVMKMTEAFARNGADVTLFVSRLEGEKEEVLREYGIQTDISIVVVPEGRRGLRALGLALGFLKIIKKAPEGTVFYIRDVKLCSWLLLLSSRFRKNYFFETHSLHRFSPYMYRICFKKARGIITTNKYKKDILILWGFGEDQVLVEPNAIDERRFLKLTTREEARRKLGISGNKKMALYLG
ncbi:MAG: glycosyltransferase, partial [Desulfobacterales bacterium]|nr:glycosyltransferase [Desulfobacterales bacterium]